LELLKGLIVPVVFASLREIFTIQPNRAAYGMRILIVEDETLVALGTQADLKMAGHSVVGLAMTSEETINLAAWCRPDLVLMDIRLAEGNAVEAAQAIHTCWAIPSLFATSHVENSAAMCHAALGCLRKPYGDRSLVASIQVVEQVMNGFASIPGES
jgi:two-component system, response regulator PdtaR